MVLFTSQSAEVRLRIARDEEVAAARVVVPETVRPPERSEVIALDVA